MSELILYEGGKKRKFPHIGELETDTQDGGTCSWIPEESATFEPVKIESNGLYVPAFAYSEVDVDVKEPINDYDFYIDENGFPHIELDDLDLSFDLDGFPELTGGDFDLDDIDFGDFDFDSDYDISFDDLDFDLSGLDLDGLDIDLTLDLDTLDLDEHELPDEIRIMHVPDKTSYQDGEEIDLDGIVVQAYRNGEVWEDPDGKYIDGYIPAHELIISHSYSSPTYTIDSKGNIWADASVIELESEETRHYYLTGRYSQDVIGSFDTITTVKTTIEITGIDNILIQGREKYTDRYGYSYAVAVGSALKRINSQWADKFSIYAKNEIIYVSDAPEEYKTYPAFIEGDYTYEGEITDTSESMYIIIGNEHYIVPEFLPPDYKICGYKIRNRVSVCKEDYEHIIKEEDIDYSSSWVIPSGSNYRVYSGGFKYKSRCNVPVNYINPNGSISAITKNYYDMGVLDNQQLVKISWSRPKDNKELTTSFYITVESDEETQGGE